MAVAASSLQATVRPPSGLPYLAAHNRGETISGGRLRLRASARPSTATNVQQRVGTNGQHSRCEYALALKVNDRHQRRAQSRNTSLQVRTGAPHFVRGSAASSIQAAVDIVDVGHTLEKYSVHNVLRWPPSNREGVTG